NGKKYWFLLDTGSAYDIIVSPDLHPLIIGSSINRKTSFTMHGIGTLYTKYDDKIFYGNFVDIPELVFGDFKINNVNATTLDLPFFEKHPLRKQTHGNIGN